MINKIEDGYFVTTSEADIKWPPSKVCRIEGVRDVYTKACKAFEQPGTIFCVRDEIEIWAALDRFLALLAPLPVYRLTDVPGSVSGGAIVLENVASALDFPTLIGIKNTQAAAEGSSQEMLTMADLKKVGSRGQGEGEQVVDRGLLGPMALRSSITATAKNDAPIRVGVEHDDSAYQPASEADADIGGDDDA